MGLDDFDYVDDDYVDPFDNHKPAQRHKILEYEARRKNEWSGIKLFFWAVGLVLASVWALLLCSLGLFAILTIILIPVTPFLFVLGCFPLSWLIAVRIRFRHCATVPSGAHN